MDHDRRPHLMAAPAAELLLQAPERHVPEIHHQMAGLQPFHVAAAAAQDPEVAPGLPGVAKGFYWPSMRVSHDKNKMRTS